MNLGRDIVREVEPRELAVQFGRLGVVRPCGIFGRIEPAEPINNSFEANDRKETIVLRRLGYALESRAVIPLRSAITHVVRWRRWSQVSSPAVHSVAVFVVNLDSIGSRRDPAVKVNMPTVAARPPGVPSSPLPRRRPQIRRNNLAVSAVNNRLASLSQRDDQRVRIGRMIAQRARRKLASLRTEPSLARSHLRRAKQANASATHANTFDLGRILGHFNGLHTGSLGCRAGGDFRSLPGVSLPQFYHSSAGAWYLTPFGTRVWAKDTDAYPTAWREAA